MLHEYHVIRVHGVWYYLRFHTTAVGLVTYYPWVRVHYCVMSLCIRYLQMLVFLKKSKITLHEVTNVKLFLEASYSAR
jgi:hypothetical protein